MSRARASLRVDPGTWVATTAAVLVLTVTVWSTWWALPVAGAGVFLGLALFNLGWAVVLTDPWWRRVRYTGRHRGWLGWWS